MISKDIEIIKICANHLFDAEKKGEGLDTPLSDLFPTLNIENAYAIQLHNINEKVKSGKKIVGKKIGLTSKAMQNMMNVDQPDYGHLLDSMEMTHGKKVSMKSILQPKVEAELAFILKKDLIGPNVSTYDVILATEYVVPSIEIVGSRIRDWKIRLTDTIADNASSGLFILSENKYTIDQVDILQTGMSLYKNDKLINTGVGAAALGNPALCVAWLANKLYEYGVTLKKGEIILSGALSAAIDVKAGDIIKARFSKLGDVIVEFTE